MPTVDPTAATVVGRPATDAEYWLCEGGAGTCAPPTVAVVLADVLGVPLHSNAEVKVRALSLDLIGFDLHPGRVPGAAGCGPDQGWTGMSAAAVAALCRSYGIEMDVASASVADLEARLAAGAAVVVSLDTEQLRGAPGQRTLPGLGLDGTHALVLTGLDRAAGLVYLNSPAVPCGTGVAIPLGQFAQAWAAAGNAVLLTELPDGAADPRAWPPGTDADPWAGLGETVPLTDPAGPARPGSPAPCRSLAWLPFSFVARAAAPVG